MERAKQQPEVKKENLIRHLANLALLHGFFYKGTYYLRGVGQKKHDTKPNNRTA